MAMLCKALCVVSSAVLTSAQTFGSTPTSSSSSLSTDLPSSSSIKKLVCDSVPVPGICSSGETSGLKSAECTKNPQACCSQGPKCSPTSLTSMMKGSTTGGCGSGLKCVGSEMFSTTEVGVCMCEDPSQICGGTASSPSCSASALASVSTGVSDVSTGVSDAASSASSSVTSAVNSFSRLNEATGPVAQGESSNFGMLVIGGTAAAFTGFFVSSVRRLRQRQQDEAELLEDGEGAD
eukprot:TRINITY_DN7105_c0_g1_i1.p1 TRINITY_DN7105_c0_g1~~TRINITY_DN7105_c0_g1_i1.p1  ORF type:complete len:236 (+),score=36.28 TRINITY_DN7105_c0_g1_i1:71-778(+)